MRALALEVAHEMPRGHSAVHLELAVAAGACPLQHLVRDVGRQDLGAPAEGAQLLVRREREPVGLLPAGARRRPDPDAPIGRPALHQLGEQHGPERAERLRVPEPRRLVGRQRVHDAPALLEVGTPLQRGHVVLDVPGTGAAGERQETGLDEVLLPGAQDDGGLAPDKVTDVVERCGCEGHASPRLAPAVGVRRDTRSTMAAATAGRGSTSSASPAPATAPGIPQTTDVSASWTITCAPTSLSASHPRRPSDPIPVSTTASTALPYVRVTDRKSTSTAGRQKFSGERTSAG